ncbi:MAG: hypothetical protein EOP38_21070 [Rubrivivax sp.]|nr:MAG: hypothetical protein EOP38_21070 [Rubrivivax sp.]
MFSVSASGSILSYQWQRDGTPIAGATGSSYTTPTLHMGDNGAKYHVVISGANASVTSATAILTVTPIGLALAAQPQAQAAKDGDVVSFDVVATGSEPIEYQWQRDGIAIVGANKSTFTTSALTVGDNAAVFKVLIRNPAGAVSSQEARLTVTAVAPRIVTSPDSVTTSDGALVSFNVTAAGSEPLHYQWFRNGSPISGATNSSYSATVAYAGSGDRYAVQVSNVAGQIGSAAAVATVNAAAPSITQHPASTTIATGASASFGVTARGTAPLGYQWQRSQDDGRTWQDISGASSATYTIKSATLADAHTRLRATVTNAAATLNSDIAQLAVQPNIHILAGTVGGPGYADGRGSEARIDCVKDMSADTAGNIYLLGCNEIRRITPEGTIKWFAGAHTGAIWGNEERIDGQLADARFPFPNAVLASRNGTIYVGDKCLLRQITSGVVTSYGKDGHCYAQDGRLGQATFGRILGLAEGADGTVFFTESTDPSAGGGGRGGLLVRKLTPSGDVVTVAGNSKHIGNEDGVGAAARFYDIGKLVADAANNLYLADGHSIRLVSAAGVVSLFAGDPYNGPTSSQHYYAWPYRGHRSSVRFQRISSIAFDGKDLVILDGNTIARISFLNDEVTPVVSPTLYPFGDQPVDGDNATVGFPLALTRLPNAHLAFYDATTSTVRITTNHGTVNTLVGAVNNQGYADGVGTNARFRSRNYSTCGLVTGPAGNLVFVDALSSTIRRMNLGTNLVETVGRSSGSSPYYKDGPLESATFGSPRGLAYDKAGNLYISDAFAIRKISTEGMVSTLAGASGAFEPVIDGVGASARFFRPSAMALDSKGNLVVADSDGRILRRVTPEGVVTTLAGKANQSAYADGPGMEARFNSIRCLAIDAADNVFLVDGHNSIRRMTPTGEVGPAAGAPNSPGLVDDVGAFARFSNPSSLAFDAHGNLYVADSDNNAIRRITPTGQVSTVVGGSVEGVLQPGLNGKINSPKDIAVTHSGRLVFFSENAVVSD